MFGAYLVPAGCTATCLAPLKFTVPLPTDEVPVNNTNNTLVIPRGVSV